MTAIGEQLGGDNARPPRRLPGGAEPSTGGLLRLALRRWAWVVAACAVVPALIALAVAITRPRLYVAKVTLLADVVTTTTRDAEAKRATLSSLVENEAIAEELLGVFGERLAPQISSRAELLAHVSGALQGNSDLVEVSVLTGDADLSAAIANAWAESYVRLVDATYGQAVDASHRESLKAELATGKADYDAAQQAYAAALADSPIDELDRAIDETRKAIDGLQQQTIEARLADLEQLRADRVRLQRLLADVRALEDHLAGSDEGVAGSAAMALELLNAGAFASSVADLPWDLQVQSGMLSSPSAEGLTSSAAALASSLEKRVGQLDKQIEEESAQLAAAPSGEPAMGSLVELRQQMGQLRAEREMERSRLMELAAARDQALDRYESLVREVAAESVVSGEPGTRVRLIQPAASVMARESSSPLRSAGIAGVVGLMLALGAAFVVEYLRWEQRRTRGASGALWRVPGERAEAEQSGGEADAVRERGRRDA